MTPEQQHRYGLEELERIRSELERPAKADTRKLHRLLPVDEEDLSGAFRKVQRKVLAGLHRMFYGPPPSPLAILSLDLPEPGHRDNAWYTPRSLDGRNPATFHIHTIGTETLSRQVETLFLREGIPGRHLLVETGRRMENRPDFLHFGYQEAYMEGWSLYAESLGEALGLYRNSDACRGRLELDRLRTSRLVLETGLHWRRWSSLEAVEFLQTMFGDRAADELQRCIAQPGRGGVPKLAERAFLRLRTEVENGLADRFDLRWYHHELLRHGPIPLDFLRGRVLRAAEERLRAKQAG